VIAKDFARLHLANMVNWGLLPLVFVDGKDYDRIEQGDRLSIDTTELKEGKDTKLKTRQEFKFPVVSPLCAGRSDAIKVGGVVNRVKNGSRSMPHSLCNP